MTDQGHTQVKGTFSVCLSANYELLGLFLCRTNSIVRRLHGHVLFCAFMYKLSYSVLSYAGYMPVLL